MNNNNSGLLNSILGYGGQVDFIRGSAEGFDGKGKPIIALGSVNPKTKDERGLPSSKIVPKLKEGNMLQNSKQCVI